MPQGVLPKFKGSIAINTNQYLEGIGFLIYDLRLAISDLQVKAD